MLRAGAVSQLRRNTLAGALGAVAGALISAISYPVYLHFLGYEQYGLWLGVSVVLSFAAFGQLGLAPAVATNVAQEYARGDLAGVRKTVSTALIALAATGAIALAGILLGGGGIVSVLHLKPQLAVQARMLLPFLAVLSLYVVQIDTLNSVLTGLGRLDLAVGTQQAGRFLSLVLAASLLGSGVGIVSLPIASLAGYVFVHATSLLLARRITGESCFAVSAFSFVHLRSLVTFGGGVLASSLINFLLGPLNKFALTRYVGPSSVPVYDMAFTMTMQIRGVLESGFRSLMPEASRLKTLGSEEAHRRMGAVYGRAMKVVLGSGFALFGGAMIVAHTGLRLWLGARFRPELVSALRVMLPGGFANLLGVPGYYMLLGVRSVRHVVATNTVQCAVNAAALGYFCHAGVLTAFLAASAASAGLAAGGAYLLFAASRGACPQLRNQARPERT
jgi:O-antigen/teichoic acid export membrane protein